MVVKKEEEEEEDIQVMGINIFGDMFQLLFFLLGLYAAFLSFKRNKGLGWSIIPALLFSPIYIVYVFATKDKNFKMSPLK